MANIFGDNIVNRFFSRIFDLLLLGILTFICCIPVVTIGPAITANYDIMLRIALQKDNKIFVGYFKAFKDNLLKATGIGIIVTVLIVGMVASYIGIFTANLQIDDWMKTGLIIMTTIMSFITAILYLYAFPLQARFENTIGATLRNAISIGIARLPDTIGLILINGVLIALAVFFFELAPLFIILEFSFATFFSAKIFVKIFAAFGDKEAAGEEVLPEEDEDQTEESSIFDKEQKEE